jgi:hypothetical protein
MAEFEFGMDLQIIPDPFPISVVLADAFAPGADGKQPSQDLDAGFGLGEGIGQRLLGSGALLTGLLS